jgi:tetratricopeptide (TPR) repeat protein
MVVAAFGAMSSASAAEPTPEAGLRAEAAGRWADAVAVYERSVHAEPAQAHLWERIADIRATRLGDPTGAMRALKQAVKHAPDDARLHAKLSQAHAAVNQPAEALAAIDRATELAPTSVDYLRARAELAAWIGNYGVALDSYERLLVIDPNDSRALLASARVSHWSGDLASSEKAYRAYIRRQVDAETACIELSGVVSEQGDFARAIDTLNECRDRFNDSFALRKQTARVLAQAQRPTRALALVAELAANAEDYELGYTEALALHHAHRTREALNQLAYVTALRPHSRETSDLARFIRTPQRSSVTFDTGYTTSSDDITLKSYGGDGQWVLTPETRLLGAVSRQRISARPGSAYARVDGGTSIDYDRVVLGIQHRLTPALSVDVRAGQGRTAESSRLVYVLGADLQPSDELSLRLSRQQDLVMVSPRAASRGIERRANLLDVSWSPDFLNTVVARLAYDRFSDGNERWEVQMAPRRAILRTQRFNLDLGVTGIWFGFDRDPSNGYYAPSRYQRLAASAFAYWKLSDDDGVSVAVTLGPYKDNTMQSTKMGGDLSAAGYFGVYRDWLFKVRAAVSDYGGGAIGGYRARRLELSLVRRF